MGTKRIFVLTPYEEEFADVFDAVREAADLAGRETQQQTEVVRPDSTSGMTIDTGVYKALANADLVVAD